MDGKYDYLFDNKPVTKEQPKQEGGKYDYLFDEPIKKKGSTDSESLSPDGMLSLRDRSVNENLDYPSSPPLSQDAQNTAVPATTVAQGTPTPTAQAVPTQAKEGGVASYLPEKHPFDYKDNPKLPQYEMFEASKNGDFKKSDDIAMSMIEKNPADPYAYRMLYYNSKKQGKPDLELLQRAAAYNPNDMGIMADMAFIAKEKGDLASASQYALQIAQMVPPKSHDIPSLEYRDYAMGILSDVAVMSGNQEEARGFVKQREQIAEQIKEKTPTSNDWVLSQSINNSLLGMGIRAGLPEGSTNPEFDIFRNYQPTTADEMKAGLGSLLIDTWAFGVGASAGAAPARLGVAAYRNYAIKKYAQEMAKRGLSKEAINVGVSQVAKNVMTSGITGTIMAASGSAGALGYYDAGSDFLRQLAGGATIDDVDYGHVLKRFEHGSVLGAMIGPLGYGTNAARKAAQTYINRSTNLAGMGAKVAKFGADVGVGTAGFGAENALFVSGGALLDGKDLSEITTKDWVMSFGTLAGLKGVNKVKGWIKSEAFTEDKVNMGEFNVKFTPTEAEAIRRLGYDGQADPTDPNSVFRNPEPILADPTVPQTAKMKIMWAGYGVRPTEFPAMNAVSVTEKDGKWNVSTTNKEGAIVTSEDFATKEQASEAAVQLAQMLKDVKTNEAVSELTPEQKADVLEKLKLQRVEPETVEAALDKPPAERTPEDIQAVNVLKNTMADFPPPPPNLVSDGKGNLTEMKAPSLDNPVKYEEATKISPTVDFANEPQGITEADIQARSQFRRDAENTPPSYQKYEIGQYATDRFGDLYQLQMKPISDLVVKEEGTQRPETIDKYVEWYKESGDMPPVKGVENMAVYNGKVVVNDGNHRVMAAKKVGLTEVPVWVSLTDPRNTSRPLKETDIEYHKSLKPPVKTEPAPEAKPQEAGSIPKAKLQQPAPKVEAAPQSPGATSPEIPEGLRESEFPQWVYENSNNPEDILIAYQQEMGNSASKNLKPWQERLLEWGKFPMESFRRFGDTNKMNRSIGQAWIAKKSDRVTGRSIDEFVRIENDGYGSNISESDVTQFITDNPSGYVRKTTDLQNNLAEKYKRVTGKSIKKALTKEAEIIKNEVPSQLDAVIGNLGLDPATATFAEMLEMVEANKSMFEGFPFNEKDYNNIKTFLTNAEKETQAKRGDSAPAGTPKTGERTTAGQLEQALNDKIAKIDEQIARIEKDKKKEADRVAKENANPEFNLEVANKGELIGAEKANIKGNVQDFDGQIRKLKEERAYLESTRQSTIDADNAHGDLFFNNEVVGDGTEFAKKQPKNKKPTGMGKPKPKPEEPKPSGGKASDWIKEDQLTNSGLGKIEFPELVALVKELTGIAPIVRYLKKAWGQFSHQEGGRGFIRLHRELFKFGNEEQLGKVIAHEIGHMFDWLPDKTMKRGNLLGRLATLRDYRKSLLKETPSAIDNILTPKEREVMRRQAEAELKEEYNKGITEIVEEVTKQVPVYEETSLTAEDVKKIWTDTTGVKENPELYDYIAGASSATKRSIMAAALKGLVHESLQGKFGKKLGFKTVTEKIKRVIYPKEISKETIRQRFKELLKDEINKRRLFDLMTIKDELKALTQWWKPFDVKADAEYTKYRHSGKELYADAISVLLNDPQALADKAPWFNRAFFNHLETKPDVKAAYEGLQELIKDPAKVFGEREQRAKEAYKAGREKILNDTKKTEKKFTIDNFVRTLVSQTSPLIKKLPNKAEYGELSTRQKVRDYVERMKFINNKYAEIIYKIKDDVLAPVEKFGMDADDFGMLLEFGRNISKTKIEKPAPGGMQAKYSVEQLQHIRNKYTDEQLKIIDESLKRFHDIAWEVIEDARKDGIYSDEVIKNVFEPNKDTYATFQAVDYASNYMSAAIQELKGSLKDIRNPLEATMAKLFAISNATYRNRAARGIVESLKEFTPEDIADAKYEIRKNALTGKFQPVRDKYALGYYENGVYKGAYVDKYFEGVFEKLTPQGVDWAVNIFRTFNKGFKPLVTSWNPGFAFLFNVIKDSRRTATNMTAISSKRAIDPKTWAEARIKLLTGFISSVKEGSKLQEGHMSDIIKEMMDAGVFDYRTGILSRYNEGNSESIDIMASRIGMGNNMMSPMEAKIAKNKFAKQVKGIVDWYFKWGAALEVGTKINAYKYLKSKGFTDQSAAFHVRNYAGTPNYKEGGFKSKNVNEYLPFSTVIIQGLRNDFSLATKPSTAGAYWFDMAMGTVVPATVMALAGAGMFGDEIEKLIKNIPEYYRYNYMAIPIGKSETGKTQYISLPMDEVSRLIYAATYGITKAIAESEVPTMHELQQIGAIGIGFIPSPSPLIDIAGAWMDYTLRGKNPTDNFRGNLVVKQKHFNAGGWPATKDMISWSLSRAGGSGIMSFFDYDPTENTTTEFVVKNIPIISRIYRESASGDGDAYREINEKYKKESGQRLYRQDEVIDDIVSKYFDDYEKQQIGGKLDLNKYRKQMEQAYFDKGKPVSKEQHQEAKKMYQKLKLKIIGGVKGDHQQLVNAIINSYSTQAAVEMLTKYKKEHSEAEFNAVLQYLVNNRIEPSAVTIVSRNK